MGLARHQSVECTCQHSRLGSHRAAWLHPSRALRCAVVGTPGVALAGRLREGPDVGCAVLVVLHVSNRDACTAALRGVQDLCQRVPGFQVRRVLHPRQSPIPELFGDDDVALFGLQGHVELLLRWRPHGLLESALRVLLRIQLRDSGCLIEGLLDVLHNLHDPLGLLKTTTGSCSRAAPRRRHSAREDRAHVFLAVMLLRRANLKAANAVYPEPRALLGAPVDDGRGRPHQPGRLCPVVRPGVQPAALLPPGCLLARNLQGGLP
mmetsp:Transcript_70818/g.219697  ORF Transcript_70818/g.219697 Transcript_70818/m.219697 type:complete len:264 (+) Transcript_70818:61-852(+)